MIDINNPDFPKVSKSKTQIKKLVKKGIVKGHVDELGYYVDFESLLSYIDYEKNIQQNYYSVYEVAEKFGYPYEQVNSPIKRQFIRTGIETNCFEVVKPLIAIDNYKYFFKKKSVEVFFENYVELNALCLQLELTMAKIKLSIYQNDIKIVNINSTLNYMKKADIALIQRQEWKYYTLKEVGKELRMSRLDVQLLRRQRKIETLLLGKYVFIAKYIVDELKKEQEDSEKIYCSFEEAATIIGTSRYYIPISLARIKRDILLLPVFFGSELILLREEVVEVAKEIALKRNLATVRGTQPHETFKYQAGLLMLEFSEKSNQTGQIWFSYVHERLNDSLASEHTIEASIAKYINCTQLLIDLTKSSELYAMTSNVINLFMNSILITHAEVLYKFLKFMDKQLRKYNLKGYKFERIINPYKVERKGRIKEVYEYEEFKELYFYASDLVIHKQRAVKDAISSVESSNSVCYDSAWLYVLMHLCNAWRNGDVISFKRVDLSQTEIQSLEWLLENDISERDANRIINQMFVSDMIISKTQARKHFFCPTNMVLPMATAIAICELRTQKTRPFNESIIDFKSNQKKISQGAKNHFFKEFPFKFASLKMNRSILTYVYILISKVTTNNEAALIATQLLRSHESKESTNIYITIPEEEVHFLTHQLFSRNYFGDISNLFAKLLYGENSNRIERTNEIEMIKQRFGSIYKIEAVAGFINAIQEEKRTVTDMILRMGQDELSNTLQKVYLEQLPSKEDHIQCLVYETSGCIKEGLGNSCRTCPYSIPNFYALSALGNSLKVNLEKLRYEFLNEEYHAERVHLANIVYTELELFFEAIKMFGTEIVLDFLQISESDFFKELDEMPSITDIITIREGKMDGKS